MIDLLPRDRHNQTLIENVRPPERVNPDPAPRYNLVVIGGGTAGLVTAAGAASLGARVAMVEREFLGGDCLVSGCVPSKGLIRSGRAMADIGEAGRFGILGAKGSADFAAVMRRVRETRAVISHHDSVARFEGLGVEVFIGEARFGGPDHVEVDGKQLHFKKAVIATGGRPVVPPIDGLAEAGFLTNETVFNLTEQPRRLLVLGGGPIGTELAQTFARLGTQVTIVEMQPQFLPAEDPDAAAVLQAALKRDGIALRLATRLTGVRQAAEGKVATLAGDGGDEELTVDEILVGVGRVPNVEGLNLEAVGVVHDRRRGIQVNDRLQTTNRRIYAAGDVALRYKFTHTADAAARLVLQNALFFGRKRVADLVVPWCTYTAPEVAHVGLYEHDAARQGIAIDTIRVDMADVDRAIVDGDTDGFLKVHLKRGSDKILGATIVGAHAGDLISEITLAMTRGVGLGRISGVIHPYPTRAEVVRKAADAYNRKRLTPRLAALLRRWFAWTR